MPAKFLGMVNDSLLLSLTTQVMSMLGPVSGQKVVEIGAGIGRFTGALAATAKSVLAVDFMENLIAENKKTHGHRSVQAQRIQCCFKSILLDSMSLDRIDIERPGD